MTEKENNNIPLIHNYCDRWCERCNFTSSCAVYEKSSATTDDMDDESLWENISSSLAEALTMLTEKAEEMGIDLNSISEEEMSAEAAAMKKDREESNQHPLIIAAKEYSDKAHDLMQKYEPVKEKGMQMINELELGIKTLEESKSGLAEMKECHAIVGWYMHQIQIKLQRAMSSTRYAEDDSPDSMYDANGSAKVALIGAERSLEAWQKLMTMIPATEDETITLLALLQKIIALTDQQFPGARSFKRPGFDD